MDPSPPSRPKYHAAKSSTSSMAGSSWGGYGRPSSPTRSVTTTASHPGFTDQPHLLISRADLRKSIAAIEELALQSKIYRQSLLTLSKSTSAFGSALEACSRIKGCDTASEGLLAVAGLKFMEGAHGGLIGDTFYREFEIPLLEMLDEYKAAVADRQVQYDKSCAVKSAEIRKTEADNIKHGRKKKRGEFNFYWRPLPLTLIPSPVDTLPNGNVSTDLQQFRAALTALQQQVDDLDYLKGTYHQEVMEAEDELWKSILDKTVYITRAQMDVYDKIASKSTDPSLEHLLSSIPDPFESWGPVKEEGQIFSVLAPLGLMSDNKSPKPNLSRNLSSFGGMKVHQEEEDEGKDDDGEEADAEAASERGSGLAAMVNGRGRAVAESVEGSAQGSPRGKRSTTEGIVANDTIAGNQVADEEDVTAFIIPSQENETTKPDPSNPEPAPSNPDSETPTSPLEQPEIAESWSAAIESASPPASPKPSPSPNQTKESQANKDAEQPESPLVLGFSLPDSIGSSSAVAGCSRQWEGEREVWERVLWKRQGGYDDDYVPEGFLGKEKEGVSGRKRRSARTLLKSQIVPQTMFIAFVSVFILVFRSLLDGRILASQLITFNCLVFLILLSAIRIRSWRRRRSDPRSRSQQDQPTQPGLDLDRPDRTISFLLPPFILYIISPLVLSLTKATTSDSIWPLAGALFLLSSVLGGFGRGFGLGVGVGGVGERGEGRKGEVELTLVDKSQSLQSCLSLTSTLSACIVLGSRLDDGRQIFALLSFVGLGIVVIFWVGRSLLSAA